MPVTPRTRRTVLTASSVLAVAIGTVVAVNAQADDTGTDCRTTGVYDVCATRPDTFDDGVDLGIVHKLREYVQSTEDGDVVHAAVFQWENDDRIPDSAGLVQDLADARDRGVTVDLILGNPRNDDGDYLNQGTIDLMNELDLDPKVCDHSCLPNADGKLVANMHMKFFTFKHGDQVRVVHTSSNISIGQFRRHQNLLSIRDDQAMYDNYVGYWNRMHANSWTYDGDTWSGADRARDGDTPGAKAYFFPRTEADPIRGTLEKLSCDGAGNRVWVQASGFDRAAVLEALDNLATAGCDVRVMVATQTDFDWARQNSGLDDIRQLGNSTDGTYLSNHNKLIITDADYEGAPRAAVYAGSHNLLEGNLRGSSDGTLRVADQDVFDIYAGYYTDMWGLATA